MQGDQPTPDMPSPALRYVRAFSRASRRSFRQATMRVNPKVVFLSRHGLSASSLSLTSRPYHSRGSLLNLFFGDGGHGCSHNRLRGTAYSPSPNLTVVAPSYRTTPILNRSSQTLPSLRSPLKSEEVTVAPAFTSSASNRKVHMRPIEIWG